LSDVKSVLGMTILKAKYLLMKSLFVSGVKLGCFFY